MNHFPGIRLGSGKESLGDWDFMPRGNGEIHGHPHVVPIQSPKERFTSLLVDTSPECPLSREAILHDNSVRIEGDARRPRAEGINVEGELAEWPTFAERRDITFA